MRTLPNNAPTNVAALDARDPNAGNASHLYGIQYGGPKDVLRIAFQRGPARMPDSVPGIFDDDLLAIIEDRLDGFQSGPGACQEHDEALAHVRAARVALGLRLARRAAEWAGIGANATHTQE